MLFKGDLKINFSCFIKEETKYTERKFGSFFVSVVQTSDVDKVMESFTRALGRRRHSRGQAFWPLAPVRNAPTLAIKNFEESMS